MYTGKGALLQVKYWTARLNMHSVSQAEICLLPLLKDTVTICCVTFPKLALGHSQTRTDRPVISAL